MTAAHQQRCHCMPLFLKISASAQKRSCEFCMAPDGQILHFKELACFWRSGTCDQQYQCPRSVVVAHMFLLVKATAQIGAVSWSPDA